MATLPLGGRKYCAPTPYDCQRTGWSVPSALYSTRPLSMLGVNAGAVVIPIGIGRVGWLTPPDRPVYRSAVPPPVTNSPSSVNAFALLSLVAGTTGTSALTARP